MAKNILSKEELIISFVCEVKNLFINLTFVTHEKEKKFGQNHYRRKKVVRNSLISFKFNYCETSTTKTYMTFKDFDDNIN